MPKLVNGSTAPDGSYENAISAAGEMMLTNLQATMKAGIPVEVLVPATLSALAHLAQKSEYADQTPKMLRMYADLLDKGFQIRPDAGTQGTA